VEEQGRALRQAVEQLKAERGARRELEERCRRMALDRHGRGGGDRQSGTGVNGGTEPVALEKQRLVEKEAALAVEKERVAGLLREVDECRARAERLEERLEKGERDARVREAVASDQSQALVEARARGRELESRLEREVADRVRVEDELRWDGGGPTRGGPTINIVFYVQECNRCPMPLTHVIPTRSRMKSIHMNWITSPLSVTFATVISLTPPFAMPAVHALGCEAISLR